MLRFAHAFVVEGEAPLCLPVRPGAHGHGRQAHQDGGRALGATASQSQFCLRRKGGTFLITKADIEQWMLERAGSRAQLHASLANDGWVPVSAEHQPYEVEMLPEWASDLAAAGFTLVDSPCFEVQGKSYQVSSCKVADIVAPTPEAVRSLKAQVVPLVLEHLVDYCRTHVHRLTVRRIEVSGHLSPTALVCASSARVRN